MATSTVSPSTLKADRKTRVYEVGSLDTIHSIALKFKMTTGELLRLNGLPSTYRIYSGQQLTVFENVTSGAPEVTRASEKPHFDWSESLSGTDGHSIAKDASQAGGSPGQNTRRHVREQSTVDLEMNFTHVAAPTYRSVPLLVSLRQMRDKKYFGDAKAVHSAISGVSDSLTATMSKRSLQPFGTGFSSIPDEMRLSSRDLVKEHVRYYINEQRNVFGELTLMPSSIIFEPALDDPVTRQLGLLQCQFQCDLKDVMDVHVIEAMEILDSWKSKQASNSANTTGTIPTNTSSGTGQSSNGAPSGSTQIKRPRTQSLNHGPSSSHLNTGGGSTNGFNSVAPLVERFDDPTGQDRAPRFLQLTVLMTKQSENTQIGRIVYFLINRQSIDTFHQKMELWCAQARPTASNGRAGHKNVPNILKPQLGLYEKHERERSGSTTTDPTGGPSSMSLSASSPSVSTSGVSNSSSLTSTSSAPITTSTSSGASLNAPSPSEAIDLPQLSVQSVLITNDAMLSKLVLALPPRYRYSDWTLLYSTERHGISLTTFYNKTRRKGPTYLIIEDEAGFRFGAYISESWEVQRSYYGTGECFLFTIYPTFNIYPWSHLNEYFIYSKEDIIALGGGSGKFALWLDQDLAQGSSAPCDTFLNSTLSYQEDFKPTIVEVWGFNDAIKRSQN